MAEISPLRHSCTPLAGISQIVILTHSFGKPAMSAVEGAQAEAPAKDRCPA
jgi:hypothetical protein